jgi:beta-glucosidase/6-phospho-beta-glucosidase/beta-galactosidase
MLQTSTIPMLPVQGVGLAAMQVYSEFRKDGSWVDSNWGRWIRSLERVEWLKSKGLLNNERELVHFVASRACEFESRWPEDFRLWLDHGLNGVRLNAPWPRINPERGKFDQEELSNLAAMPKIGKQMGLSKPAMTWYHWQMPGCRRRALPGHRRADLRA